jgi:hypothetical protein
MIKTYVATRSHYLITAVVRILDECAAQSLSTCGHVWELGPRGTKEEAI